MRTLFACAFFIGFSLNCWGADGEESGSTAVRNPVASKTVAAWEKEEGATSTTDTAVVAGAGAAAIATLPSDASSGFCMTFCCEYLLCGPCTLVGKCAGSPKCRKCVICPFKSTWSCLKNCMGPCVKTMAVGCGKGTGKCCSFFGTMLCACSAAMYACCKEAPKDPAPAIINVHGKWSDWEELNNILQKMGASTGQDIQPGSFMNSFKRLMKGRDLSKLATLNIWFMRLRTGDVRELFKILKPADQLKHIGLSFNLMESWILHQDGPIIKRLRNPGVLGSLSLDGNALVPHDEYSLASNTYDALRDAVRDAHPTLSLKFNVFTLQELEECGMVKVKKDLDAQELGEKKAEEERASATPTDTFMERHIRDMQLALHYSPEDPARDKARTIHLEWFETGEYLWALLERAWDNKWETAYCPVEHVAKLAPYLAKNKDSLRVLHIIRQRGEDIDHDAILALLGNFPNLTSLSLDGILRPVTNIPPYKAALKNLPKLTHASLAHNNLPVETIETLVGDLPADLKGLNLKGNNIDGPAIAAILRSKQDLRVLDVSANDTVRIMKAIDGAGESKETPAPVTVSGGGGGGGSVPPPAIPAPAINLEEVKKALQNHPLKILNLTGRLRDIPKDFKIPNWNGMILWGNVLSPQHSGHMPTYLQMIRALSARESDGNYAGFPELAHSPVTHFPRNLIVDSWVRYPTIQKLPIVSLDLNGETGIRGLQRLERALRGKSALRHLDISETRTETAVEVDAFVRILESNPEIHTLGIAKNLLSEEGVEKISAALEKLPRLTSLDVSNLRLTDTQVSSMVDGIKGARLSMLNLSDNLLKRRGTVESLLKAFPDAMILLNGNPWPTKTHSNITDLILGNSKVILGTSPSR